MNRLGKISGALLALSVFLTFEVIAADANKPQLPNILSILIDDMGTDDRTITDTVHGGGLCQRLHLLQGWQCYYPSQRRDQTQTMSLQEPKRKNETFLSKKLPFRGPVVEVSFSIHANNGQ